MIEIKKRIDFANLLRGLAAIMVVCSHFFGVFWYRPEVISYFLGTPAATTTNYILHLVSVYIVKASPIDLGPMGVAIFFLISGMVIPFSVVNSTRLGFFANRFMRIYPTYICGFAIAVLNIYLINLYFGTSFPHKLNTILFHWIPGIRLWFNSPEIDGVLWTLEVEILFYLIWIIIGNQVISLKKVIMVTIILLTLFITAKSILINLNPSYFVFQRLLQILIFNIPYLFYFFIGTLFFLHYNKLISWRILFIGSFSLLAFMFLTWKNGPQSNILPVVSNYIVSFFLFLCVYIYPSILGPFNLILEPLSKISYSLYASHSIAGYCIQIFLLNLGLGSLSILPAFIGVLMIAYYLNKYVEEPTQKRGKQLATYIKSIKRDV